MIPKGNGKENFMVEIIVCAALLLVSVVVYVIATMRLDKHVTAFKSRMAEFEADIATMRVKIESLEERLDAEDDALDREMDVVDSILDLQRDLINSKNEHDTLLAKHDLYIQDIKEKMEDAQNDQTGG